MGTFWPFCCFKFNFLSFFKRFKTLLLDTRIVNKNISAIICWRNKTKSFSFIKPLYGTTHHTKLTSQFTSIPPL
ncbi:hypothetical protein BGP_2497 [Beggiatoa sp. PS]|nr:hypothetical protein BGP_2497 [Beggiatoa sp. PS]